MFKSKRELDAHVRALFFKSGGESEKAKKCYSVAKLYFALNEFETAKNYLDIYLESGGLGDEERAEALRTLGEIHVHLNEDVKALEAYQQSYKRKPSKGVLDRVCDLLHQGGQEVDPDDKVKQWLDLQKEMSAENNNVTNGNGGVRNGASGGGGYGYGRKFLNFLATNLSPLKSPGVNTSSTWSASTWSSVTSPGFTTRVVHENGAIDDLETRNIRTFTDGGGDHNLSFMNRSSFNRSPNGPLRLGQLPMSAVSRRTPSSMNFPTPSRGGRSNLSTFNRFSRVHKRDMNGSGVIFVKLANIERGSGPPVTPISTSSGSGGGVSPNGSYGEQGQRIGGGLGLGGIPRTGLVQPFSRMWPSKGPPTTGLSAMAPPINNVLEVNRKRERDLDLSLELSRSPTQSQNQGPISSTPIASPDEPSKYSKRVKYVSEQDLKQHPPNRPLAFDRYQDLSPGGSGRMTSKSILEQMNQTEKRFLPDSSPVTSAAKRTKTFNSSPRGTSTPLTVRKRTRENGISMVEIDEDDEGAEDPKSKTGKFCHCSECYAEAAGQSLLASTPPQQSRIYPKKVTFGDNSFSQGKEYSVSAVSTCDKGTEMEFIESRPEILIRKAEHPSTIITKEKYDYDRIKRIERFKRILGLEPKPRPLLKTTDNNDNIPSGDEMDGKTKAAPVLDTLAAPVVHETQATVPLPETPIKFGFGCVSTTSTPAATTLSFATFTSPQVKVDQPSAPLASSAAATAPVLEANTQAAAALTSASGGFTFGQNLTTNDGNILNGDEIPKPAATLVTPAVPVVPATTSAPATTTSTSFSSFSSPQTQSTLGVFGTATAPSQPTVSTTAPACSIGQNSTTTTSFSGFGSSLTQPPASTTAPTISFGQNSTTTAPFSGFGTVTAPAQPVSSTTAPAFSIGQNSTTTTTPFSGFGTVTAPTQQAASTAAPAFSIGQNSTAPFSSFGASAALTQQAASTTAPAISFGQNSTPATSFSSFGAASTQPPTAATAPAFSFGQKSETPASFSSFGGSVAPTKPAASTPASGFSFGQNSGTPASFTGFGAATAAPASGFGTVTAPTQPAVSTPASGFSFGQNSTTSSFSGFGSVPTQPAATTTAPAISFGQNSTTKSPFSGFGSTSTQPPVSTTAPAFSFGQNSTTTAPFSGFGSAPTQPAATTTAPAISFGQNSTTTTSFSNFGAASTQPLTAAAAPAFSFGQNSGTPASFSSFGTAPTQPLASTPASGFTFGQNSGTPASFSGFGAAPASSFSSVTAATQPATSTPASGFTFGQTVGTTAPPVFQFGQQPANSGFNFASQAAMTTPFGSPSPQPNNQGMMFNHGQSTSVARRGRVLRRR